MKKKEPRSLNDILSGQTNSLFTALSEQKARNNTLLSRVRALLPSQIAQHLVAATYREDILVLVADSPAWANRLRFESENIRKGLINNGYFSDSGESEKTGGAKASPVLRRMVTRTAADKII